MAKKHGKPPFFLGASLSVLGVIFLSGCEHLGAADPAEGSIESQTLKQSSLASQVIRAPKTTTDTDVPGDNIAPGFERATGLTDARRVSRLARWMLLFPPLSCPNLLMLFLARC